MVGYFSKNFTKQNTKTMKGGNIGFFQSVLRKNIFSWGGRGIKCTELIPIIIYISGCRAIACRLLHQHDQLRTGNDLAENKFLLFKILLREMTWNENRILSNWNVKPEVITKIQKKVLYEKT